MESTQEWFESEDNNFDNYEISTGSHLLKFSLTNQTNIITTDINVKQAIESFNTDNNNPATNIQASNITNRKPSHSNPIQRFYELKQEIDKIENDLENYKENKEVFKGKTSLSQVYNELQKMKKIFDSVKKTENFQILNKITSNEFPLDQRINLLNKTLHSDLKEQLLRKIQVINEIRSKDIKSFKDVKFEFNLTPDSSKNKIINRLNDMKEQLEIMNERIGEWDATTRKMGIGENLHNLKIQLRLFDPNYQKEIQQKIEALNTRLNQLNEGKEEFYQNINKPRLDELFKLFPSAIEVEELIHSIVEKFESQTVSHEDAAYIFVKLKEMINQQEKLAINLDESSEFIGLMKEGLDKNSKLLQNNIDHLKERMNKLS